MMYYSCLEKYEYGYENSYNRKHNEKHIALPFDRVIFI